ncbi:hypothetical protein DD595_25115 [Enterobacter cloacae complex sp. 4DZ3-17B2]|nr:hypothetical protein DD595_25115 [Enterobacter cloacae complex sp. 4DZ3-17B2]
MLCRLLKEHILPADNVMPDSRDEARKILRNLGMDYNSIHACPNDCILFRGEYTDMVKCPKCDSERYRVDLHGTKIPQKVLRHFPLLPRIKHFFECKSMAALASWHEENKSSDGVLRIPADCAVWKHIDGTWSDFAREARNLRLGLAMDGVNPFGQRSTSYSVWPVVIVNYNIPPWLTTKKGHLWLSLIVPGRYKVGNMDVYLRPLLEELQQLWIGIEVVDMSRHTGRRNALIRGILMWTMHDYPGLTECS